MKKIIVYGTGISGKGVAEVLKKHGEEVVFYTDDMGGFEKLLENAKLLVLSPGVSPKKQEVIIAQKAGLEVLPEIEIGFRNYNGNLAGITGTNGKTTTTTLVGEMFKTLGVPSKIAGNIGLSLSKELEGLPENSWVAAELSSFQLEMTQKFAPQIACVLNLTPDHLERHHTLDAYYEAKKKICINQNATQYTVLNYDDNIIRCWNMDLKSQICYFSRQQELTEGVFVKNGKFVIRWHGVENVVCDVVDMKIFGPHNIDNALAAIAVGFLAGCLVENMAKVIKNFCPVEHRLEYVRTIDGVKYYNDSKATNTDSAIKALESFPNKHIILIAGGHDKLTDLHDFMECVKKYTDVLILLGEAKDRFNVEAIKNGVQNIYLVNSFEESVRLAYKLAKVPQVVLLSPACSSYDMFNNYQERGIKFKDIVKAL